MEHNGKDNWSEALDRAKELFDKGWKEMNKASELAKSKGADVWEEAQKQGRETWGNAKAKGMEMWEDAKSRSVDAYEDARERGEEMIDDAEKIVRKHPMRAIGLSVLIGLFIGALFSRDRD